MKQIVCEKIDKRKFRKFTNIRSETEWLMQIYRQFGFKTFEDFSKTARRFGKEWYEHFYWSEKTQQEWIKEVLKKVPAWRRQRVKRSVIPYFLLDKGPTCVKR
ncbi:MAG: hypothetical protein ACTSYG_08580 [Candidatus Heimdallarchaeota archaeon]